MVKKKSKSHKTKKISFDERLIRAAFEMGQDFEFEVQREDKYPLPVPYPTIADVIEYADKRS